jgi:hypothetical protein
MRFCTPSENSLATEIDDFLIEIPTGPVLKEGDSL